MLTPKVQAESGVLANLQASKEASDPVQTTLEYELPVSAMVSVLKETTPGSDS
jgi:hypothetical protein